MSLRHSIIAIVGRPNVGKSTLFNRIVAKRLAVVEDMPGVTRDRHYALVERYSVPFVIVDTGGFEKDPKTELDKLVVEQTQVAAEEADLIIALFDGIGGLHPEDEDVVEYLRKSGKPVVWAVNKCDGPEHIAKVAEFYSLGLSEIFDISALHGYNIQAFVEQCLRDLPNYKLLVERERSRQKSKEAALELAELEQIQAAPFESMDLPEGEEPGEDSFFVDEDDFEVEVRNRPTAFAPVFDPDEADALAEDYEKKYKTAIIDTDRKFEIQRDADLEEHFVDSEDPEQVAIDCIRVAIVGRPNVGKSTLLNTLVGEQRVITSDVSGTTRDVIDSPMRRDGQDFLILDTAGLRRKGRITDNVERYSTMRAIGAIADCDVAVVVLDALEGPTDQDAKVVGLAHENGRGIVIAVNKWDLLEKDHTTVKQFERQVKEVFKFAAYAPIVYISALSGKRCPKVIEEVKKVAYERTKRVSTGRLNRLLERSVKRVTFASHRGIPVRLYYGAQVASSPPTFALFFNYPKEVHFSNIRYIKNSIRDEFGFEGSDVKFVLKKH